MMKAATRLLAVVAALLVVATACSRPGPLEQVACSVVGDPRFDVEFLDGPSTTFDELVVTPQGEALLSFFVGGTGELEGQTFLEANGFSIVNDDLVLSYVDERISGHFGIDGDVVSQFGSCNPTRVFGDRIASRWSPAFALESSLTTIDVAVETATCVTADGDELATTIDEIDINESSDTSVDVVVWSLTNGIGERCRGIESTEIITIELEAPIGERQLADFGVIPPESYLVGS